MAILLAIATGGCRKATDEGRAADARLPDAEAGAVAAPSATAAVADAGGLAPATVRGCRVIALRGDARVTLAEPPVDAGRDVQPKSRSLSPGELLPDGVVIELGSGSALTVAATMSGREITLVGPATAEACPSGDEAVRLTSGKVTSFPGAGIRPGAEVWVATPLGVVRFNDAEVEVDVAAPDAERLNVALVKGRASFFPAAGVVAKSAPSPAGDGGRVDPAEKGDAGPEDVAGMVAIAPGAVLEASRPPSAPSRWVQTLVAACARQGSAAEEAARRLAAAGSAKNREALGDLAFAHVRARKSARAACEAARAAGALSPRLLDPGMRSELARAERKWRAVPSASASASVAPP